MKILQECVLGLALMAFPLTAGAQSEIVVHDTHTDKSEIFDLPEGMASSEDSLLHQWLSKNFLFPDTTCENPDYNPVYAPEIYKERLHRLPTLIEMPYNDVVQKFIDKYSGTLRKRVSYMLGAANFYVPLFESALDAYQLPLELKYLPIIESALDPKATSPVGAAGLWQFMVPTGRKYNLTINSLVDERRDPIKSTWAAARYLRDLYKIYGDWSLVLAAYNAGPTTVNKAIHRAGGEHDYWKIYQYLPKETRGYVPAFIAANYIMNYYCDHNICPMKTRYPVTYDTVMVDRPLDLRQVAEYCKIDLDQLRALNPQYKTDLIPGQSGPCSLCMTQEAINRFLDNEDSVYAYRADEYLTHRAQVAVNMAEDLSPSVSKKAATAYNSAPARSSRNSHARTNTRNARNARNTRNSRSTKHSKATHNRHASGGKTATVKKGDSLYEIARRHKTTVANLKKKNKIKGNTIHAGQKLRVK